MTDSATKSGHSLDDVLSPQQKADLEEQWKARARFTEKLDREAAASQVGIIPPGRRSAEGMFVSTNEHRRFNEFVQTVRRHRTIGLCHGPAGVGKTRSARKVADWDSLADCMATGGWQQESNAPTLKRAARNRTMLFTPVAGERVTDFKRRFKHTHELVDTVIYQGMDTRDRAPRTPLAHVEMLIIDEAERLSISLLEWLRSMFDASDVGMVLIGMPGMERTMSRHPQLYSRTGFSHRYSPLSTDELKFVVGRHWKRLKLGFDPDSYSDTQAVAAIARLTRGNFRLVQRLFLQIERIVRINHLSLVTEDVVDAAASVLIIGQATE